MSRLIVRYRVAAFAAALTLCSGLLWGSFARSAAAADLPVGSLSLAPADAAFYSASLRSKEQYDLVMQSRAWNKLKNMPAVQMGMMFMQFQLADPESPLSQAKAMLEAPENQELVALLADMAGEEMFVYGSQEYQGLLELIQAVNTSNQFAPIVAAIRGGAGGDPSQAQRDQLEQTLLDNLDKLVIPDTVLGFKITMSDEADAQIDRLEKLLKGVLAQQPRVASGLKRKKVGDAEYLSLTLTGEMIPWDEIEDQLPDSEGRDKIVAHIKAMTLEINLGVRGEYVILSFGDNSNHLAKLGQGKTLSSVKELQKLAQHADERLTGVGYASEAFMSKASSSWDNVNSLTGLADQLLADAEVDDDVKERIKRDVTELTKDLAPFVPQAGAVAGVSFLNDAGTESFLYNWGSNPLIDGSKPLSLLNHVGSDPLVAAVGRGKYSPDSYATLVKWLKKAHGYFEDFAVPQMDEEERDKYQAVWPEIVPLLKRLDNITGKMLVPSLADGQSAFVLDAKMSSNQWLQQMPPTAFELPLIEPAFVTGVTDSKLLLKAMGEYRVLLNDALDKLEEVSDGEAKTDFRLQAPEMRKFEFGDVYYYRLPAEAGVDKRLAPNGGLSDSVMAISLSPRTTVRLLESKPMELEGPLAVAGEHPAFAACYVNLAGLMDALTPWIDLGIRVGVSQFGGSAPGQDFAQDEEDDLPGFVLGDPAHDSPTTRQIISQVHDAIDVIKVFQNYQSLSYLEDGVQVTHGQWRMVDAE